MNRVTTELDEHLAVLLAEGTDAARRREATLFDELTGVHSDRIVLFGAGNLGRRTLKGLRELGIEPVCFLDNNQARWGYRVEGVPVLSPGDGAARYGAEATFVITVWGALGTDRMASRVAQLQELGCKTVVPFVPLYWKHGSTFLPHYTLDLPHLVHQQADQVRAAFDLMSDERSQREYIAQIRFRLLGDFDCLPDPVTGPMYFREDLFTLRRDETFVDCGGFNGDSLSLFLEATGDRLERAIIFEPDPSNFADLQSRVGSLPSDVAQRIVLYRAATGKVNERVMMEIGGGPSSQIGKGSEEVDSFALDSILEQAPVSLIKMDIEGSEIDTLEGARRLIQKHAPILTISAYHRQSDLWNIPLLIERLNPDYSFHLRPHMIEGWDLVCYAVPRTRKN
jgi:FkbM family methyltransferase